VQKFSSLSLNFPGLNENLLKLETDFAEYLKFPKLTYNIHMQKQQC
jgi:hypothetical protein